MLQHSSIYSLKSYKSYFACCNYLVKILTHKSILFSTRRSNGFEDNSNILNGRPSETSPAPPANITPPSAINSNNLPPVANTVPPALPPAPSLEITSDMPYSKQRRDLVQKLTSLRQELHALQPQSGHCRLEVSREDIFEVIVILYQLELVVNMFQ